MSLDSAKIKPQAATEDSRSKNFFLPVFIIVLLLIGFWVVVTKYNFSRLSQKTKTNSPAKEVNAALDNLSENLDQLKSGQVFSQNQNSTANSSTTIESASLPSTSTPALPDTEDFGSPISITPEY